MGQDLGHVAESSLLTHADAAVLVGRRLIIGSVAFSLLVVTLSLRQGISPLFILKGVFFMSRWHLTSSKNADHEARLVCQQANLRPSRQISDSNCHGQAYLKRVVPTPNLIKCGETDWICSAGTIIYDGRLGEEALRDCYTDFVTVGISAVQSKAIGHYAVAIRHNHEVMIFTDPQGALDLFYIDTGDLWFVSNSIDVCASVLPYRKIDTTKLLVTALQSSLLGEDTFYSGIKRLFGTQLIRVDLNNGRFRVERIPDSTPSLPWSSLSIQDAIEHYKQEVCTFFRQLAAVEPIGIFATGGIDSRTVLASLLNWQTPVQLMYGVGNSRLTDYDTSDLDIARTVAKLYDVPFQQLDWSGNQPHNKEALQELFRIYGFKYEIYGAPESFIRAFNGGISPYPNLFLGGRGPALTNSKPWELNRTSFTFDDLITDGMHYPGGTVEKSRCVVDKAAYRSVIATEMKAGLRCAGIDYPDSGASLETFVRAKTFLYIRAESRFLNFVNEFGHYIEPFLMKRLHDPLLSVPFEYRTKDKFQLLLIHSLAPALLEVPLYSGWSLARIDRDAFHLIRDRVDQKRSLVSRAAHVVLPSFVRKPARNFYSLVKVRNQQTVETLAGRDAAIVKTYSRNVLTDPLGRRWFNSTDEFTPKVLARIYHYLVGVNTLGYSE
jgi:hypothetical protein